MLRNIVLIGNNKDIYDSFHSRGYNISVLGTKSIHSIKNSIILLLSEFSDYHNIDNSNIVVLYAPNNIEPYMLSALPRVNKILTTRYDVGYKIANKLYHLMLNIPIQLIDEYLEPVEQHIVSDKPKILVASPINDVIKRSTDYKIDIAVDQPSSYKWWDTYVLEPDINKYDILIDFSGKFTKQAISMGLTVITDIAYDHLICDGVTGYISDSDYDLTISISELNDIDNIKTIGSMCYKHITSNARLWCENFIIAANSKINDIDISIQPREDKKWVVSTTILHNGNIIKLPINCSNKFSVVDLDDLEAILKFLISQKFSEVVVLGWNYGENNDNKRTKILNLVNMLGNRSFSVYWCPVEPIPSEWKDIFSKMIIMPISEGLKRVANI